MPVGLLPIIYLAFISLGLPDSAIGSAWPTMAPALGAGISWVGAVTMIISAGTIVSSLFSVSVVRRFGTGIVTVVSVVLTAAALVGFSTADAFWQLCLWAVPYGLGAGAIDAGLNAYVALHYKSMHMNWLHCMWGVGASAGPAIMAQCLARATWSEGFFVLGAIQAAIAVVLTLSLPLWSRQKRRQAVGAADEAAIAGGGGSPVAHGSEAPAPARRTRRELLRIAGVPSVMIAFFCYSAFETTCGTWAATYCTLARGIDAGVAASWASFFYLGITMGRAVSGFISIRVADHNMIRLGQALIVIGLACVLLPGQGVLGPGLVLVGAGCAPIYPSTIHATPGRFGTDVALELAGMQMAFATVGSLAMSPLFGVLAQTVGAWLYPFYLIVFLVGMVVASEHLNRAVVGRRA